MAERTIEHAWKSLRLVDLPRTAKRLLGLPEDSDFSFSLHPSPDEHAATVKAARLARGAAASAIFVHGILPRSGSNFAANLLAMHPDLHAFPGDLWEVPTLATARASLAWRHEWLARFPENARHVSRFEPLAWTANGMMRCLQDHAPKKRLLLKSPHLKHASLFDCVFPGDKLVIILRDGRDIIASSRATFKDRLVSKGFRQLATEWRQATELAMKLEAQGHLLWRYEELVADPEGMLRRDLKKLQLDEARFPFRELNNLPVFGSSTDQREGSQRWNPSKKPRNFNPVGRGQSLGARKLRSFANIAGQTMAKAGYS